DKGAPAALFMARTKTLIRLVATLLRGAGGAAPPHQIIARVNEELCQDNVQGMFVTVFFGMLDSASGELRFCNAGHNVPYVLGPTGAVAPVHGTRAKPLGIRPTLGYASDTAKLEPGDCLFLFTDGITESMDGSGAFFSEERLESTLRSLAGQCPRIRRNGAAVGRHRGAGAASRAVRIVETTIANRRDDLARVTRIVEDLAAT